MIRLLVYYTALSALSATPSHQAAFSPQYNHKINVSPIYQFPNNGSWIENIAVRRNGQLLVTRLDVPELWSIDPKHRAASLLHSFSEVTSLAGITEVREDVFAIAGFNFSTTTGQTYPGSGRILLADLSKQSPSFKAFGNIPQSILLNGIATFDPCPGVILIAESIFGLVYKLDLDTGAYALVSNDTALQAAPDASSPVGVNGLKVRGNYLYFTSSSLGKFGRLPLTKNALPAGPIEISASLGEFLDDFVLARDGTAFIATDFGNTVIKVIPDGSISTVAGSITSLEVAGDTSLAWAPGVAEKVLYVATGGAQSAPVNGTIIEPAKIVTLHL
jgi:hypothetical protein